MVRVVVIGLNTINGGVGIQVDSFVSFEHAQKIIQIPIQYANNNIFYLLSVSNKHTIAIRASGLSPIQCKKPSPLV